MSRLRGLAIAAVLIAAAAGCGSGAPRGSSAPSVEVVQTTRDLSQHLERLADVRPLSRVPRGLPVIAVDDARRYQRVTGVGAALTDTSAWLIADELAPEERDALVNKLFTPGGIGLTYLRIPIAASDFTRGGRPYSYDDLRPGATDTKLLRFSIAHDYAYVIPVLRRILAVEPGLRTVAAPWSPPPWMKSNDAFDDHVGRGRLLPGMYPVLARYLVRFLDAYQAAHVPIDAITPQNEPGQWTEYPGLNLSDAAEGAFISRALAPALRAAGLSTQIYAHDYKWTYLRRVAKLVARPAVRARLDGVAWHCYEGDPAAMSAIHKLAPGLDQIESECSAGDAPGPAAEAIIASMRNWASAVLLWNLALDRRGGPVQPPNYGCHTCTGVVTIDEHTHRVGYTRDYFDAGQFGRFVAPGAYRIASSSLVSYRSPTLQNKINWASPGVDDVAFRNPDGSEVLLAHNNAPRTERFAVAWHGRGFAYALPAGATVTFIWR